MRRVFLSSRAKRQPTCRVRPDVQHTGHERGLRCMRQVAPHNKKTPPRMSKGVSSRPIRCTTPFTAKAIGARRRWVTWLDPSSCWSQDKEPYSCGTALDSSRPMTGKGVTNFTVTARAIRGYGHLCRVSLFDCTNTIRRRLTRTCQVANRWTAYPICRAILQSDPTYDATLPAVRDRTSAQR
jgi:hypothetical protein